jgi:hypothetical protein
MRRTPADSKDLVKAGIFKLRRYPLSVDDTLLG